MMKKIKIVIPLMTVFLFSASLIFAAAESKELKEVVKAKKAKKDMTASELSSHIKGTLEHEEEILNFIPALKKEKDDESGIFYTYEGVRLEKLDREKLDKLFSRVQNEAVRIRTERLNRQLESIRQAQQASLAAQQASRVPVVVSPPRPQTPPPPPSVYQVPKPPPTPPAPPRR